MSRSSPHTTHATPAEGAAVIDALFAEGASSPQGGGHADAKGSYYASFVPQIQKRDGSIVPFDFTKIVRAISLAMEQTGEGSPEEAEMVAHKVVADMVRIAKKYKNFLPTVEGTQDEVERQLILSEYVKTAKHYILYREEHARVRKSTVAVPEHVRKLAEESSKYFAGNPLGEFVYLRTYARWIEEESRRETWIETVDRYVGFMRENLGSKLSDAEYAEVREAILKQEAMPSMRLLQFAGKPARRCNAVAYNCSFIAPTSIEDFGEVLYLSASGCGVGFSAESKNIEQLPQIKEQTGVVLKTHVVADSKEGWASALVHGMKTWYDGKDVQFDYALIRPAGARLRTMGGKASGPEPLRSLLDFTRSKILSRQNRRLRNIDAHDILCKIGEAIVSGGVRRSAMISLSDLDDDLIRHAKDGAFYNTDPHRMLANNSAVYEVKPSSEEFMEEWMALMKGRSGERGIFNRGGLMAQLPKRRLDLWEGQGVIEHGKIVAPIGTNPCVPADTWVMTDAGARRVRELIGVPYTALVNGKRHAATGFFQTGEKEVYELRTRRGYRVRATSNHKILVETYRSRKTYRREWKELGSITVHDRVVLHEHEGSEWGGRGTRDEGWLLGNLYGDGNIEHSQKANLDYWGPTQGYMLARARSLVHATVGGRSDLVGHVAKTGYARLGSTKLGTLAAAYSMVHGSKVPTDAVEEASSAFYRGFLQGWFDADGSVQGNQTKGVSVRLASSKYDALERAQRMLARLGIISTLYRERRKETERFLPDGRGGVRLYSCAADHELVISGENIHAFAMRIGFSEPAKAARLSTTLASYRRVQNREVFSDEVVALESVGVEAVYDCTVEDAHAFDANGVYVHNCGEIILKSKQFCNLSEVIARRDDTLATLKKKVRIAAILGTYQSSLTSFSYLSQAWVDNCASERLLGVSVTGQWDSPESRKPEVLRALRDEAIAVNKKYAKRFGIPASTAITAVKPSGTVSQTVNCASGMHPRHSEYYIRRIRITATDSLFKMLKDQGVPYHPEVGQVEETANTFVLEFPVKSPKSSVYSNDLSALEQLEYWRSVKENYTEHNPSVTISIGDNEWVGVANWLYEHWEMIGGLSFLPRENHSYRLAPYEAITREQYEELAKRFENLDYSKLVTYELRDETEQAKELACAGGTCEIV